MFVYHHNGHYFAARLSDGGVSRLEVLESLSSRTYCNDLTDRLRHIESADRILDLRMTGWQTKDANADISAAVEGCGCYAMHAAFHLQRGTELASVPPPHPESLVLLRLVASLQEWQTAGDLRSRWLSIKDRG